MNRDKHDIIGQIISPGRVEGGDSVNWMGHWLYLSNSEATTTNWTIERYIKTFETSPGAWVRHPDPDMSYYGFAAYYKNPWNGVLSRDQLTGILAALMKSKSIKPIARLLLHHALRGFLFAYNTIKNGVDPKTAKYRVPDLTLFDIWAMELRAVGAVWTWLRPIFNPILTVLDLHMLLNTIHVNYFDDDIDAISFAAKLITSIEHNPTVTSKITFWLCDKQSLLNKIQKYWCGWRDSCDMYPLYERKLK